ncbi:2Fe-2S iron-sulfur cluster-binding protein [Mesorhizobium sp.]|uniref:2Fe-2S iron-sulfur cluster-binding protein n=1 Tax=Mesorhizobium sp. TaxID=1871066 RepID=UPI000FE8D8A8|nr:2Fe-2S iron-sulfur cluster-binding protein [Mesorhizobium sp.]RWM22790.1 MAG: 2Fe-2S iron-sulfur cluster binding domain-containing protein [Mesorhizobium sp.]
MTPVLIRLTINDREREADVPPGSSLLTLLRDDLGLTGAHYGCGHGACGLVGDELLTGGIPKIDDTANRPIPPPADGPQRFEACIRPKSAFRFQNRTVFLI